MVTRPAALAPPGSLSEIQMLRPHTALAESESDAKGIHVYITV